MSHADQPTASSVNSASMSHAMIHCRLVPHPVVIDPQIDETASSECGAACQFLGLTREELHPEHGRLIRLDYQVYEPMAERVLGELAREAAHRFGCRSVWLEHAIGSVPVGQASVAIRVTTPHRSAAFEACRWLIDTLKQKLPVWKREVWEHGETFVEGQAVAAGDLARPT